MSISPAFSDWHIGNARTRFCPFFTSLARLEAVMRFRTPQTRNAPGELALVLAHEMVAGAHACERHVDLRHGVRVVGLARGAEQLPGRRHAVLGGEHPLASEAGADANHLQQLVDAGRNTALCIAHAI